MSPSSQATSRGHGSPAPPAGRQQGPAGQLSLSFTQASPSPQVSESKQASPSRRGTTQQLLAPLLQSSMLTSHERSPLHDVLPCPSSRHAAPSSPGARQHDAGPEASQAAPLRQTRPCPHS